MPTMFKSWKDVPKDAWRWRSFSPRELACKGTGTLLINEDALDRLQVLRNKLGVPMLVTSAYRSKSHNTKVGGASNSYHMKGMAFDIRMENQNIDRFIKFAKEVGFNGIGYYPKQGFIHIDTGPARTWGIPFTNSVTGLPQEPEKITKFTASPTVKAVGVGVAATVGQVANSVAGLDGNSQAIVIGLAAVALVALLLIYRDQVKRWLDGML